MPIKSAGILLFRRNKNRIEVFLGHAGGPFWAKKDNHAWSIPKGEIGEDEDPLTTAKREFKEETGFEVTGHFFELKPFKQSGGKIIYAWAVESNLDASRIQSNTFRLEWPPDSGKFKEFPEIDKAAWFSLETARIKMFKGQLPLLEQFEKLISKI